LDVNTVLFTIAVLGGIYMACNIGANDVANSMGTSVGSKSLTFRQAIWVAAIAEFAGAFFVGGNVSDTIRKGMLDPTMFQDVPLHLVCGMIGALIASGVWLHLASSLGWPVSTTHSIVGAVVGFGIIAGGMDAISWGKMGQVVVSWVVSPVMGGLFSYMIFRFILWRVLTKRKPLVHAKVILPYMVFFLFMVLTNAMVYKGLKNLRLNMQFGEALFISILIGAIAFMVAKFLANRIPDVTEGGLKQQFTATENIFKYLQIITAFYIAFAHGSNDVANAVGPLAAAVSILREGTVQMEVEMPLWILGLGGSCIVFGLVIWGSKVMKTIGEKITEITPSRGFSATFGAATVVLICSKMGLPISTTHTLVGSVIGVGLARGLSSLDLSIVKTIVISWFATVPFTMVLSMIIFKCLIFFLP